MTETTTDEGVTLSWWWALAGGVPAFAASAAIASAVNNAHGHDWWVLCVALAGVIVAATAAKFYPNLTIRPRSGKTARAAAIAVGATTGAVAAAIFTLGAVMMDSAYYDGYDDGFRTGIDCGVDYARNYDSYAACVADHNAGYRPPANWGD